MSLHFFCLKATKCINENSKTETDRGNSLMITINYLIIFQFCDTNIDKITRCSQEHYILYKIVPFDLATTIDQYILRCKQIIFRRELAIIYCYQQFISKFVVLKVLFVQFRVRYNTECDKAFVKEINKLFNAFHIEYLVFPKSKILITSNTLFLQNYLKYFIVL